MKKELILALAEKYSPKDKYNTKYNYVEDREYYSRGEEYPVQKYVTRTKEELLLDDCSTVRHISGDSRSPYVHILSYEEVIDTILEYLEENGYEIVSSPREYNIWAEMDPPMFMGSVKSNSLNNAISSLVDNDSQNELFTIDENGDWYFYGYKLYEGGPIEQAFPDMD